MEQRIEEPKFVPSPEMLEAARESLSRYGDIIDLPCPVSRTHPPLSAAQRAAQFAPFAALQRADHSDTMREIES